MAEINEIRFTGTIDRLQPVKTRTGNSMAMWLLQVGRDKFKCVAFKNIADAVLQLQDGDHISITGTGSINSWKDDQGRWHNDFQVSCWSVDIDGKKIVYEKPIKEETNTRQTRQPDACPPPQQRDDFSYQGGPF